MRPILSRALDAIAAVASRLWPATRLIRLTPVAIRRRVFARLADRAWPRTEATVRWLGATMRLDLRDDVQRSIFFGLYEREELALLRKYIRPGDVVVDVGANVGFHTCHLARQVGPRGHVYAFEPEPRNIERLTNNVGLNGFTDRVSIHPVALSHEDGSARFFRASDDHSGWGSLNRYGEHVDHIEVETRTVDSLIEREGLKEVALLKVDVEGADFDVYRGAAKALTKRVFRHIMAEWNGVWFPGQGRTFRSFIEHFGEFGYRPITPMMDMSAKFESGELDANGRIINVVFQRR